MPAAASLPLAARRAAACPGRRGQRTAFGHGEWRCVCGVCQVRRVPREGGGWCSHAQPSLWRCDRTAFSRLSRPAEHHLLSRRRAAVCLPAFPLPRRRDGLASSHPPSAWRAWSKLSTRPASPRGRSASAAVRALALGGWGPDWAGMRAGDRRAAQPRPLPRLHAATLTGRCCACRLVAQPRRPKRTWSPTASLRVPEQRARGA